MADMEEMMGEGSGADEEAKLGVLEDIQRLMDKLEESKLHASIHLKRGGDKKDAEKAEEDEEAAEKEEEDAEGEDSADADIAKLKAVAKGA